MTAGENRFFPWNSDELPENPYLLVHDSMIQKYGLEELSRIAQEEFGRPVEIRAYPGWLPGDSAPARSSSLGEMLARDVARAQAKAALKQILAEPPRRDEPWRRKGKRRARRA